jgi:WD40 repeat protein
MAVVMVLLNTTPTLAVSQMRRSSTPPEPVTRNGRIALGTSRDPMAVASYATVDLYDAATGRQTETLRGHDADVDRLAYDRAGRLLASASWNGATAKARVWATSQSYEQFRKDEFPVGNRRVLALALDVSHGVLATGTDEGLRIWDVRSGGELRTLAEPPSPVRALAFALKYDEKRAVLASAGASAEVRLWDAMTGELLRTLPSGPTSAVAFGGDGRWLAAAGADGSIRLWSLPVTSEPRVLAGAGPRTFAIAFSRDGQWLDVIREDGALTFYETGGALRRVDGGSFGRLEAAAFSVDGLVAALLRRGASSARLLEIDDRTQPRVVAPSEETSEVAPVAVSASRELVAIARKGNTTISIHGVSDGARLRDIALAGTIGEVRELVFSPDGRLLVAYTRRVQDPWGPTTVLLFDVDSGKERWRTTEASNLGTPMFSPDGSILVAADGPGDGVTRWDVPTGRADPPQRLPARYLDPIGFLADGTLAVVRGGTTLVMLEPTVWREVRSVPLGRQTTREVISEDRRTVAVQFDDYAIIVLDPSLPDERRELGPYTYDRGLYGLTHDGKAALVGELNGSMQIVDVATGAILRTISNVRTSTLRGAALDGRERWLVARDPWRAVAVWDLTTGPSARPRDVDVPVAQARAGTSRAPDELRTMLRNQPDFTAALVLSSATQPGREARTARITRKGSTVRIEYEKRYVDVRATTPDGRSARRAYWLLSIPASPREPLRAVVVAPELRAYRTLDEGDESLFMLLIVAPYVGFLLGPAVTDATLLTDLGTEVVDGHTCVVVESTSRQSRATTRNYAARDLRGLVVRVAVAEDSGDWFNFEGLQVTLRDVTLDPAVGVTQIPNGYREDSGLHVAVEPRAPRGDDDSNR